MFRKMELDELKENLDKLKEHGSIMAFSAWVICMFLFRIEAAINNLKQGRNG